MGDAGSVAPCQLGINLTRNVIRWLTLRFPIAKDQYAKKGRNRFATKKARKQPNRYQTVRLLKKVERSSPVDF